MFASCQARSKPQCIGPQNEWKHRTRCSRPRQGHFCKIGYAQAKEPQTPVAGIKRPYHGDCDVLRSEFLDVCQSQDESPRPKMPRLKSANEMCTRAVSAARDAAGDVAMACDESQSGIIEEDPNVHVDCETITLPLVTKEEILPQVHTIYEQVVTREIHYHEYRLCIQPVIDTDEPLVQEEHWLEDSSTGELTRISTELGRLWEVKSVAEGKSCASEGAMGENGLAKAMEFLSLDTPQAENVQYFVKGVECHICGSS